MKEANYNEQQFYRAHLARDPRFDGKFFVAVKTTGIYCRPVCPARKAALKNLTFYLYAAQAEEAGYRPCLRCRPETAPGSAAWIGTSAIIKRAMRMMEQFALDNLSIQDIANKLGMSDRWLRQLFKEQVGASPQTILLTKKLDIARSLLDSSNLPITHIAMSAGFQSIRRFNDAFKKRYQKTPSNFRKKPLSSDTQSIYLRYRPPLNWQKLLAFFKLRAIPGMERVSNNSYQRLFYHNNAQAWMCASLADERQIKVSFKFSETINILDFVGQIRHLFDLDADPLAIENDLNKDPKLKPVLKKNSGLRVPGCLDNFELAVRAIIGQKISVKAARTVLTRLVKLCGKQQTLDTGLALTHFFPTAKAILNTDLSTLGITKAKAQTLHSLAQAVDNNQLTLDGTADDQQTCNTLLAIKGIGPWTVEYIAMRALKHPDAFPSTDLELKKQMKRLHLDPNKWTPWKAYAAILLFSLATEENS